MENKQLKVVITIAVAVAVIIVSLATAVNLNGGSADFSDREVRVVITDSMDHDSHPGIVKTDIESIPTNSLIMIHKLNDSEKNDLRVGDVISFWQGSTLYTHRIVKIDSERQEFTTRGDNTSSEDMPIPFSSVQGKVVGVNTPLGQIVQYIRTFPVICILVVILAFIAVGAIEYLVKDYIAVKKGSGVEASDGAYSADVPPKEHTDEEQPGSNGPKTGQ